MKFIFTCILLFNSFSSSVLFLFVPFAIFSSLDFEFDYSYLQSWNVSWGVYEFSKEFYDLSLSKVTYLFIENHQKLRYHMMLTQIHWRLPKNTKDVKLQQVCTGLFITDELSYILLDNFHKVINMLHLHLHMLTCILQW